MLGAFLVEFPRDRILVAVLVPFWIGQRRLSAMVLIGIWFAIQLIGGVGSITADDSDTSKAEYAAPSKVASSTRVMVAAYSLGDSVGIGLARVTVNPASGGGDEAADVKAEARGALS